MPRRFTKGDEMRLAPPTVGQGAVVLYADFTWSMWNKVVTLHEDSFRHQFGQVQTEDACAIYVFEEPGFLGSDERIALLQQALEDDGWLLQQAERQEPNGLMWSIYFSPKPENS